MNKFKQGLEDFSNLFLFAKDKEVKTQLFELFFTAEERFDLSMRYWIIKDLIQGIKTQRQIAEDLRVSIAKITRGSNEIKRLNPKFLNYLKNHYK